MQIKNKIDGLGNPKTLKQIKTKLSNRKDAYKFQRTITKNLEDLLPFAHILMTLMKFLVQEIL